jgi:probable rRNA maturation factor
VQTPRRRREQTGRKSNEPVVKVWTRNLQDVMECPLSRVRRVVRIGLRQEGRGASLSVALLDDAQMTELNKRFLGRDGATDVLAFPYGADDAVTGEILVNAELAARRACEHPHDAEGELMLYVVHGLLHLLGYDDHGEEATRVMRRREQEVLREAGYEVGV